MRNANDSIDWDKLLADDGSLPYVPHVIDGDVLAPEPMLIAVVTTPAHVYTQVPPRRPDGIEVAEGGTTNNFSGIVDCILFVETRWTCVCKRRFRKVGRHNGVLRTCKVCRTKYFLRIVPAG